MHVYFKSIALENVRCFGKKQTIDFTDKDGKPSMWNLILGENGVGKTTVLKGILSSWDQGEGQVKNSGANLNEVYFMRTNTTASSIENELYIDNEDRNTSLHFIAVNVRGILATPRFYSTNLKKNDITLFAYGASRRIGDTGITEEQTSTISTLLDENASLINAEEWLAQSEYLSLKDKTQINLFNRVKTLLLRLFEGEISDIKIETNAQANKKISVLFQTHYGWVPLHQLSLGYKTMIGWMVDFARGLFDRYPDSTNPLAEPAVCLVDEIDLHLHPHFQRNLMRFLSDIFPKTQFIVTAHSPLVVQAAADVDANIILLERKGDEVHVNNNPQVVHSWRVDQILTSDLFGLDTALSPEADEKMERRRALLRKEKRSKQEEAELVELEADFDIIPPEESALGQRMVEHLQRLAAQ